MLCFWRCQRHSNYKSKPRSIIVLAIDSTASVGSSVPAVGGGVLVGAGVADGPGVFVD